LISLAATLCAKGPVNRDAVNAEADFADQGEYVGKVIGEGKSVDVAVQVIALGDGKFQAVGYVGGLPGAGWNGKTPYRGLGQRGEGVIVFEGPEGRAELKDGKFTAVGREKAARGTLAKVDRRSPTLGKTAPEGAVVLFDGTDVKSWRDGRMSDEGWLEQGCRSQSTFQDHDVHIEFRLPFEPERRGQQRGNSGIYLQGRYEVQMLDSFGLEGKHNECGGIYEVKDPDVNMCFPPLAWQTYDIQFTAARFDDAGSITTAPRITVRHNGMLIHDDVELPRDRSTRAAPLAPGPSPGPIYLQDHGNPVRYRNIWVVRR
jgi:hypothetical protein